MPARGLPNALAALSTRELIQETLPLGAGIVVRLIDAATGLEAQATGPNSAQGTEAAQFYAAKALLRALIAAGHVASPAPDTSIPASSKRGRLA